MISADAAVGERLIWLDHSLVGQPVLVVRYLVDTSVRHLVAWAKDVVGHNLLSVLGELGSG
jgi:hypothetical protein